MQGQTIEGENVSLRAEVERLKEREAASREIIGVIGLNRSDEQPVLDAITQNAVKLCDATGAGLWLSSDARDVFRLASVAATDKTEFPVGMEAEMEAISPMGRCMRDARTINVADIRDDPYYLDGDPVHIKMIDEVGIRSRLIVPLVENGIAFGCISLIRKEVRSFSDDEVTLIESFAEQAVIAIENVRQFCEVQERLEREEATRQILGVISQSRNDEKPVFEMILDSACRLCDAPLAFMSLVNDNGTHFRVPAHRGATPEMAQVWDTQLEPIEGSALTTSEAIRNRQIIQVDDLSSSDLPDTADQRRAQLAQLEKVRTYLVIPLIHGERAIGTINLYRRETRPFLPEQIKLVETFAAQAVIAIENVRQFREVQERLEREVASAEILEVISRSRDDDLPVFNAILENASRLCNAPHAFLQLRSEDDSHLAVAAQNFAKSAFLDGLRANPIPIHNNPGSISVLGMNGDRPTMYDDVSALKGTKYYTEQLGYAIDREGMRTALFVPLRSEDKSIGVIVLYRLKVAPFSKDEIALVQTFAAQAVIAIENVRQFKALEKLNAELGDRVEEQVGEIERMGKLKRFLPAAVADTVVSTGSEKMLKSHRALLGVLFCDIRGFTAFCETAEPEETIEVLQTYHEEMGKLINAYGAGVDHRSGDGIMVLFNDPVPCDDPAGDAVRLAVAMRERMADLCQQWKRMGYRLGFGVGVSLGYATVGMVGFEGRFDYTASGTAINLASRLCDEAADGEILLSPRASIAVEDNFHVESRGELNLKGLREPLEVFRLTGVAEI